MSARMNGRNVAKVWASGEQAQSYGRGKLFTAGEAIFSYGAHFPIARFTVDNKTGEKVVRFTTRKFSPTTSKHCSFVRGAIPSGVKVILTSDVMGIGD